jgi:hypothetical protein
MDALAQFLEVVRQNGRADGNFRGLLHILIGRAIVNPHGETISRGLTWRGTAALLKKVRWNKDAVAELGLIPADLPPRDREKYWYTAIAAADVDSEAARQSAENIANRMKPLGYTIGPAPTSSR